jgi:AraC family transcriptional regulator of adaptative response / DNA-3-methyladenine glycosylase II
MLNAKICQKARLSRDPRFDGKFFTAVKTTGIYCRTICPVFPPKEKNVQYFATAVECANAGFRPCLRCRPDSAPDSPAWKGVSTTLERAINLINEGALQNGSLPLLAERLGISDRYLRQLFTKHIDMSPKAYALYQQCLFAKQLLHQTDLPITQIALASGFASVRRFNDCFHSQLKLTPTQMRKSGGSRLNGLQLRLYYRPPYNWSNMQNTLNSRAISGLEWCDEQSYGRTFQWLGCVGSFTAKHHEHNNSFEISIELDNLRYLKPIIHNIRRILDLNVDMQAVEDDINACFPNEFSINSGIRLPGVWSVFEAGVRAVLGQQISVAAARNLVEILVHSLGEEVGDKRLFPTPESIASSNLAFFKMPGSRKQTLHNLAQYYLESDEPNDPIQWLKLKGIGPWTVAYSQLRGLSDPDIFLGGDLGVQKAMVNLKPNIDIEQAAPWRSYLTFQLWSQL